jgi:hypothetical protein
VVAPWAIPAVLALTALAVGLVVLPKQHRATALRLALGLWIATTLVALPLLLSRS